MRTLASMSVVVLLAGWSTPVFGQSVSEMAGKKFADSNANSDQQIVNASRALEEAIKTYATSGESTRGATGPISSLLIESDTIICASWLMAFDQTMKDLAVKGAFNGDAGASLMNAMQQLKNRVEAACQRVLNNTDPPGNHGPGGEGGDTTPSPCPECEDEKQAAETAKYRLDHAQFELDRATNKTNFAYELAATQPGSVYSKFFLATPQELEREQKAKETERDRAQRISDDARKAYLDCLEACNKRTRAQYGFFDRNQKALLVTAAALVATTVAVVGGGGSPTTLVSTSPAPQPVANTPPPQPTTPVVTAPTPPPAPTPPTLASLIVGRWICAACSVMNDLDRHENTLRFCAQLVAIFQLLANSPLRIEHPAPWVTVTGELDENSGAYRATGIGAVSGFSNVSSTVTAAFQRSGDTVTAVNLTVTLGENGVFPGGRPVSYSVRLTKQP